MTLKIKASIPELLSLISLATLLSTGCGGIKLELRWEPESALCYDFTHSIKASMGTPLDMLPPAGMVEKEDMTTTVGMEIKGTARFDVIKVFSNGDIEVRGSFDKISVSVSGLKEISDSDLKDLAKEMEKAKFVQVLNPLGEVKSYSVEDPSSAWQNNIGKSYSDPLGIALPKFAEIKIKPNESWKVEEKYDEALPGVRIAMERETDYTLKRVGKWNGHKAAFCTFTTELAFVVLDLKGTEGIKGKSTGEGSIVFLISRGSVAELDMKGKTVLAPLEKDSAGAEKREMKITEEVSLMLRTE